MHVGSHPTDHSTLDGDALPNLISQVKAAGYGLVTVRRGSRSAERQQATAAAAHEAVRWSAFLAEPASQSPPRSTVLSSELAAGTFGSRRSRGDGHPSHAGGRRVGRR